MPNTGPPSNELWIFTLTFLSLCCLYLLLCTLWLLYSLFKPKSKVNDENMEYIHESLDKFYVYISISCLIFSLGTVICDLSHAVEAYTERWAMFDFRLKYITATADIFFVFAMTAVYLFMIGRVYYTFKDSYFQLNNKLTAFLLVLISMNFIIWTIYIVILITETNFHRAVKLIRNLEIALLVVDFTLNISLLLLFISKLHELLLSSAMQREISVPLINMEENEDNKKNKQGGVDEIILDENQKYYISIISKHTLLCTCAIALNLSFYLSNLYSDFIRTYDPSQDMYLLMYCGRSFGVLVNAMVVFFNFKFTVIYYNFFCYCCHLGINKCFKGWTKRRIMKRRVSGQ